MGENPRERKVAKVIKKDFFCDCNAVELAEKLVGKIICYRDDGENRKDEDNTPFNIKARIIATKANLNNAGCENDKNKLEGRLCSAGHLYICKDENNKLYIEISAGKEGVPESVTIVAVDIYDNAQDGVKHLYLDEKTSEKINLMESKDVWLENDSADVELKQMPEENPYKFKAEAITYKFMGEA